MLEDQIARAHADRAEVPELCRLLMGGAVIIVGSWADAEGSQLLIQDFRLQGTSFIPLFSDQTHFWGQLGSTPFLSKGLEIDCKALIPIFDGHELLILNPGSTAPVQLSKMDFEPFLYPSAGQKTDRLTTSETPDQATNE